MQGKIGVLIEVNCETDFVARNDSFKELVKDISMHIAASAPLYVKPEDVPADKLEKEKEIAAAQVTGKPANIVDKIVAGKIEKYYSDVCLIKQPFIKDNDKTIEDVVKGKISELGENIVIRRFTRYQVGEEI
jgi:elongation factor Ts